MKNYIVLILVVTLLSVIGIYEKKYIKSTTKELTENLKEVKEKMNDGEKEEALKKLNETEKTFDDISLVWGIILENQEIDQIDYSISELKADIENNDISLAMEKIYKINKCIENINLKNKVTFYTIT